MGVAKHLHAEQVDSSLQQEELLWVKQVRENKDRSAFEKIFRRYYKRLYHFSIGFVGEKEAEDVVQSVFLKIWIKKEEWNLHCSLKKYLFTAVRNEALNIIRHREIEIENIDAVTRLYRDLKKSSYPEENSDTERLIHIINDGIEKLPPRCREIFILSRKNGLSYSEIADVLNITLPTVGTQMGRALKSLKSHLSDYLAILIPILTFFC